LNIDSINKRLKTLQELQDNLVTNISEEKEALLTEEVELRNYKNGRFDLSSKTKKQSQKAKSVSSPKQKVARNELTTEEKLEYLRKRDEIADPTFFNTVKDILDQIPESNGSKFYPQLKVNIGIIADEFLFNSFQGMANFIYITKDNYKKYRDELDLFFVVTTWKGLNMEWKGLGNPNIRKHRNNLFEIINFYKSNGIKVVFYSKEDPVNYDIFIEIAQKCDYVYTTAVEKVDSYKNDCKNDNADVLNFGINPIYHNPIGIRKFPKRKEVLFSGSWYNKYPHREVDTRIIFDGIIDGNRDLKIIDRNYDLKLERHFFPVEYLKYVSPAVDHAYLQKLHKLYDWAINLNSVKDSETMFANRIYELQALGNVLLSNYSQGVNNKFPNVFLIHDKNEVKEIMNSFTEDELYKHQVYGIRRVMSHETSYHRLEQILDTVGINFDKVERRVAVVVKEKTEEILAMFNRQSYQIKELILESELSEETKSNFDLVAFFNEENDYLEFYLEDMINGFKYTNSDYVTKDAYYKGEEIVQGIEHDYVTVMKDKYRTVFWSDSYTAQQLLQFRENEEIVNGYSIDHFEFNAGKKVIQQTKFIPEISVIVPVYNNGDHLLNKCFNSLKRSSMFNKMEIILVDDGSTDGYTPRIIEHMAKNHLNIKTYYFNDGGSGSASRPRNKGAELSVAPYITYLDPDNEAINDGYTKLYQEMVKGDYDFVVGNMVRIADKVSEFNYYKTMMQFNGDDVISSGIKDYLVRTVFKAMSIQALVLKRELIEENSLKMVEGAIGQDTLFFQELMLNSKKVKAIDLSIHIYYAAVSGSAVNTITKKFFERYFLLEKSRIEVLKNHGLFEQYVATRFEYYFKNWYLEKLKKVTQDDFYDSVKLLTNIFDLYRETVKLSEPAVIQFARYSKKSDFESVKDILT
jgi:glycosyltransferase involved in cell wall biosynthesis